MGDDHHALGLQCLHQRIGDLLREALLDLQAGARHRPGARSSGTDDAAPRQVADVHRAVERKEMMLAGEWNSMSRTTTALAFGGEYAAAQRPRLDVA